MTPKEKGKALVIKFIDYSFTNSTSPDKDELINNAKQCALIAVDEILDIDCEDMSEEPFNNHIEYWQGVKQEIEKL